MPAPGSDELNAYLGDLATKWDEATVTAAFDAEKAAQASRCRVPADDADWPDDLAEALCRRVAVNLSVRALPLGVQSAISEVGVGFARVGGQDREVSRLEAPYRKLVLG